MFPNADGELFAALGGQQLRIAQAANAVSRIEDHGGGDYRTEERSASDFDRRRRLICAPAAQARFSNLRVHRSRFSRRSLAAAGERASGGFDLRLPGRHDEDLSSIFAEEAEGTARGEIAGKLRVETELARHSNSRRKQEKPQSLPRGWGSCGG